MAFIILSGPDIKKDEIRQHLSEGIMAWSLYKVLGTKRRVEH
jgi:hypothetical protein